MSCELHVLDTIECIYLGVCRAVSIRCLVPIDCGVKEVWSLDVKMPLNARTEPPPQPVSTSTARMRGEGTCRDISCDSPLAGGARGRNLTRNGHVADMSTLRKQKPSIDD